MIGTIIVVVVVVGGSSSHRERSRSRRQSPASPAGESQRSGSRRPSSSPDANAQRSHGRARLDLRSLVAASQSKPRSKSPSAEVAPVAPVLRATPKAAAAPTAVRSHAQPNPPDNDAARSTGLEACEGADTLDDLLTKKQSVMKPLEDKLVMLRQTLTTFTRKYDKLSESYDANVNQELASWGADKVRQTADAFIEATHAHLDTARSSEAT